MKQIVLLITALTLTACGADYNLGQRMRDASQAMKDPPPVAGSSSQAPTAPQNCTYTRTSRDTGQSTCQ